MAQNLESASWREQLSVVKNKVVEAEKRKALERKLQIQRTKEGIQAKLKEDTPDALERSFREIETGMKAGGRELFPVETMQAAARQMEELNEKVQYYLGVMKDKQFADLFSSAYQQTLRRVDAGIKKLRDRASKQVDEWSKVKLVMDATQFRGKLPEDEPTLIHVAKTFHQKAHGITLNLPSTFFSRRSEGLWVATFQDIPYAYVMETDVEGTLSLAVGEVIGTNFLKLVRGFMHTLATRGPLGKLETIHVRVTSRDEVKFYTNLNFLRTAVRGMLDWTYSREIR